MNANHFDPVIAEIARAEFIHGPFDPDGAPSDLLLHLLDAAEVAARMEPRQSPLAVLVEEVCEMARATTDDDRHAELTQIEAVCARYRAALAARS